MIKLQQKETLVIIKGEITLQEIKRWKDPLSSSWLKVANIVNSELTATVVFIVWAWQKGSSRHKISAYMLQAEFGPPIFIFLQILQTVVPIISQSYVSTVWLVFIFLR